MKEQSLIEMKNKIESLVNVVSYLMQEQQHLTTLAAGTLETIKLLPGYDDAIKTMTEKANDEILKKKVEQDLSVEEVA